MRLDRTAIESTIAAGLPVQARWLIDGTPLDLDFTVGRIGLQRLPDEVLDSSDTASFELLVFGEQDFAEGEGPGLGCAFASATASSMGSSRSGKNRSSCSTPASIGSSRHSGFSTTTWRRASHCH
jgi:hypothetical protein